MIEEVEGEEVEEEMKNKMSDDCGSKVAMPSVMRVG